MAKFFLPNPGFELGDRDWTKVGVWAIVNDAVNARSGAWVGKAIGDGTEDTMRSSSFSMRPGGKISGEAWVKGGTVGNINSRIEFLDKDNVLISLGVSVAVTAPIAAYTQLSTVDDVAPDRTKSVLVRPDVFNSPTGTYFIDDISMTGDIIEVVPTTAKIQSHRLFLSRTIGAFEPLIGNDKFTEFNAGMSDKWAGVFNFIPLHPDGDLGELVAFLERLGQLDRFFAFDPDRLVPKGGVVNGMLVDGAVTQGTNKIPIKTGPVSSTALVAGDYIEVKDQYLQLIRDLEIGPEGTGEAIVQPTVRSTIADGEDVITNNPKMVARFTSEIPRRSGSDKWTKLSMSWEEV